MDYSYLPEHVMDLYLGFNFMPNLQNLHNVGFNTAWEKKGSGRQHWWSPMLVILTIKHDNYKGHHMTFWYTEYQN